MYDILYFYIKTRRAIKQKNINKITHHIKGVRTNFRANFRAHKPRARNLSHFTSFAQKIKSFAFGYE